mmetsp:Transcript_29555/g.54691  ORF Transcript_29555/g.54691 Transcript_29555/m.54691 type:complete len:124 (-) Transcript_29555:190-561(-)
MSNTDNEINESTPMVNGSNDTADKVDVAAQLRAMQEENERLKAQNKQMDDQCKKQKSELAEIRSRLLNANMEIKDLQDEVSHAQVGSMCCFGSKKNADELAAPGSTSHPARNKGGGGSFQSAM